MNNIDWSGIVGGAVRAFGTVQQTRAALVLQRAQQAATLRSQEAEFQLMQRRQAQTVAAPVSGLVTTPSGEVMRILPDGGMARVSAPRQGVPESELLRLGALAALGLGVLFLMRK